MPQEFVIHIVYHLPHDPLDIRTDTIAVAMPTLKDAVRQAEEVLKGIIGEDPVIRTIYYEEGTLNRRGSMIKYSDDKVGIISWYPPLMEE